MGSVMFSMAMLAPPEAGDPYFREREALPPRVGRIVLSQIGPVVVFTPANVFRAYLMSYLRAFLPLANYEFRIGPAPSLTDQLIDRALAAMPYPESEFGIENPWWPPCKRTPWVGSRHRMDALYGRDFNVENVSPARARRDRRPVRAAVDRHGVAGDPFRALGRHHQPCRPQCLRDPPQPARALEGEHGRRCRFTAIDNGLYDVATLARMDKLFKEDLGLDYTPQAFTGSGIRTASSASGPAKSSRRWRCS